jgi:hypothetical protein
MVLLNNRRRLREARRDLSYGLAKATGWLWLRARLGAKPKPWVRHRQLRDLRGEPRRARSQEGST